MIARQNLPTQIATLFIGILVFTFIAWPLGSMLLKSFVTSGPAPLKDLQQMTVRALDFIEPIQRKELVDRWVKTTSPEKRMEAIAAALEMNGHKINWNRQAAYNEQISAADRFLDDLTPLQREEVLADLPISIIMLHRRIPLAFMVKEHLTEQQFSDLRSGKREKFGLTHYRSVLSEERLRNAASNSLFLATTATLITTTVAFLLAFGINRGGVKYPETARYGILIPLVSPPVVIATAAILLFGRNGLVTKSLLDDSLGMIDAGTTNLYGVSGVILAQVLSFIPPAFIILDNVLSKQDGCLEEAAVIQGASFWQRFWNITLPMSQPGLIRAATLVFILSMTDFGNPMVIGKDMPVLAGVLYDEMIGFHNTPLASAIAVWLIVPALCTFVLLNRLGGRKRFETSEVRSSEIELPKQIKKLLTFLVWFIIGFSIVIYGTILIGSFVKLWGQDFTFTPHHYTAVEAFPGFVSEYVGVLPVWTSLKIVLVAAPLGGLLAVAIAFLAERVGGFFNESLTFTVLLPAILPGVVFGIGYLVAFNSPLGFKELSLNGTNTILVINILFGNVFVGVLAGRAMLRRLDSSVDEAAEILGASLLQRFTQITLPMMRRAALLGTFYIFVDGLCTFSAVVFLQGPDIDLASVAIFQSANVSYYGIACAMSVTILAIVFVAMGALVLLNNYGPASLRDPEKRPIRGVL